MKTTLLATAFLAAAAAFAQTLKVNETLTVNQTLSGPLINTDDTTTTVTITGASAIAEGATTVLEATLRFTLPSADPVFSETVDPADRLVIAAKADGSGLLVSDAGAWTTLALGVPLSENTPVAVRAEATLAADGTSVQYLVTAGGTSVTVTRPNGAAAPAAIALEGVGSASALALKQVSTGVLPPAPDGSVQDAALVDSYVAWENDADKGGALKDATDEERQNAFAMNVGGTPKLEIVAIDTAKRTVTVKGSHTVAAAGGTQTLAEPTTADLTAINGVLTVTAQDTLSGAKTTYKVDVTAGDGELVKVRFPNATARFVKATVDVYAPADAAADPIEGTPVSETAAQ